MFTLVSLFGLLGSIAATILFFPQVWKSYKIKRTKELAWFGIVIGLMNGACWTVYGLLQADKFIYITNMIQLIGASLLLILKMKYH